MSGIAPNGLAARHAQRASEGWQRVRELEAENERLRDEVETLRALHLQEVEAADAANARRRAYEGIGGVSNPEGSAPVSHPSTETEE